VNARRAKQGLPAVVFTLTDLKPHVGAWERLAKESANVGYLDYPVDAADPPAEVAEGKVFRIFNLAFHHLPDEVARRVMQGIVEGAEGFAIVELQDRRVGTVVLMVLHGLLVFLTSWLWYWRDPLMLVLTYLLPIMPFVMAFDGMVSGLRTREFDEVMELI